MTPGANWVPEQRRHSASASGVAIGVATTVWALVVVVSYPRHLLCAQRLRHHLSAHLGVALDDLVLVGSEWRRLEQHGVGHTDLADVVDQGGLV